MYIHTESPKHTHTQLNTNKFNNSSSDGCGLVGDHALIQGPVGLVCVLSVCKRVLKVGLDLFHLFPLEGLHLISYLVHHLLKQ